MPPGNRIEQEELDGRGQYSAVREDQLYSLKGCDWKGLVELIEKIRARVARELNRPVEIISCYEAGYDGFWLHRLLEAHGVRNDVIDPASVQLDRRARRAKTTSTWHSCYAR